VRSRKLSLLLAALMTVGTVMIFSGTSSARARRCFDGDHTQRGIMRGDVNGDGDRDAAWVTARRRNDLCRYFLKVNMGDEAPRQRLRGADRHTMRHFSHIAAMVEVDLVPGKEIGVTMAQGASASFFGLFTIRDDDIKRVRVDGRGAPPGDLFASGGSIGFTTGSDCARNRPPGTIIHSTADLNNDGDRYKVKRRWFMTEGVSRHFDRTAEPTSRRRVRPGNLDRLYEFDGLPFNDCEGRVRG
jgi:hypothetical protein